MAKLEALKREEEEERLRAKDAARQRVLEEFEKGQLGLATRSAISTSGAESEKSSNGESRSLLYIFGSMMPKAPASFNKTNMDQHTLALISLEPFEPLQRKFKINLQSWELPPECSIQQEAIYHTKGQKQLINHKSSTNQRQVARRPMA